MARNIEKVQFLVPVRLVKGTARSEFNPLVREWRGWSVEAAANGGRVTFTDDEGRMVEVPRANCAITWAAEDK
jgi:hypothetical protein